MPDMGEVLFGTLCGLAIGIPPIWIVTALVAKHAEHKDMDILGRFHNRQMKYMRRKRGKCQKSDTKGGA